ncbi:DUF6984 family protein [Zavarzinia compransoris]|uniref:DUF6984 family protein n=1 Tax=Zavarzinia compransoris TaxID=1264899 RepID=UPI00105CEC31|nr:hypothetical protein [Zavarzinia compransoris]
MVRDLTAAEKAIIAEMLHGVKEGEEIVNNLDNYKVATLNDGGMGSLRIFKDPEDRTFGEFLSRKIYKDIDGTEVVISIILDRDGVFFELDVWRVDFEPVKHLGDLKFFGDYNEIAFHMS